MMDDLAGTALATAAFAMVDFAARRGLPRERLLAAAKLDERLRDDPDARVPDLALVILWRELLTAFPDEPVTIALVAEAERVPMGVLVPLARTADTLRAAIDVSLRYGRLVDSAVRVELVAEGDEVGIAIRHRPEVEALGFPFESMTAWAYRALRDALGDRVPLARVTFSHTPRHAPEAYERFFHVPVRFGAPICALWLHAAELDRPVETRDEDSHRYLADLARRMLEEIPPDADPFRTRLRAAIAEELAATGAELERVARRLAMSTRTLQRRLAEAGTTFQEVVDDVRHAAARRLLRDPERTILEVAGDLGYADLPGFYRAFKRWTGRTPAEWRKRAS